MKNDKKCKMKNVNETWRRLLNFIFIIITTFRPLYSYTLLRESRSYSDHRCDFGLRPHILLTMILQIFSVTLLELFLSNGTATLMWMQLFYFLPLIMTPESLISISTSMWNPRVWWDYCSHHVQLMFIPILRGSDIVLL